MAMQAVKDHINSAIFIGERTEDGGIKYRIAGSKENLSTLKWYQLHNSNNPGEVLEVYRTKTTLNRYGNINSIYLEAVDMSKVKINVQDLENDMQIDFRSEFEKNPELGKHLKN